MERKRKRKSEKAVIERGRGGLFAQAFEKNRQTGIHRARDTKSPL